MQKASNLSPASDPFMIPLRTNCKKPYLPASAVHCRLLLFKEFSALLPCVGSAMTRHLATSVHAAAAARSVCYGLAALAIGAF